MSEPDLRSFIINALAEDTGDGDHSSLASIPSDATGRARLIIKEEGIISGLRVAREVFTTADPSLTVDILLHDGDRVKYGDIALTVSGRVQPILRAERIVLNIMQRMSGIATSTARYTQLISDTRARITDTRKTTPGMRALEKEAVRTGGGVNHRMGLYDMIMLKDNHTDYAGGITRAISRTKEYLRDKGLDLKIEVEARNINEVKEILDAGGVHRIMLDNFNIPDTRSAVKLIAGRTETESSGGITLENVRDYALCGVDYISIGALTHHIKSLDMSLKAF
ncbi:MAG: carboxylating nicotinate-nucleotide diphosphorylase [Bacteroidales bacterium]|jgi:nicotinate-nucleotide pyrophosphorylase (carboxylating)|nr:carboxylating nicotinate-nucleotide diphosphorylase [Bacteroidales bacterium]MCB9028607.1 carboxylating nicotinate-nucleotide diphosphorylase [Bacteroidales bacterium]MDD3736564.1 carboxylating nicotinate-nucleotide diphosphorylase [Bacteroidales bacterium]HOO67234.1 carboxylating nicotinate-nucleotide diphosphorylase [Bacteroidales bacterium]HPE23135.1 carboxylating nicotinate-nucleotide diphosphorylase [Bacteroidales bacterium]